MQPIHKTAIAALLALLGAAPLAAPAQSAGGPYEIAPVAIAGGGATLGGGSFQLSGTIGQPATASLAAGAYHLYDGFWAPVAASPQNDTIFINGFDP